MNTYYGLKHHMTQLWDESGNRYAATLIKVEPLQVTQVKSANKDGYIAVQVGFASKSADGTNQPLKGHLKKSISSSSNYPRYLREVRLQEAANYQVGDRIKLEDILTPGDQVTVTGISKGRGFAGVVKRWGFHGGPRTHGQSDRERAPGSIGQGTDPGRVHKGKKMPGRYGNQAFTIKNLTILSVNPQSGQLTVSGPIPGAFNSLVKITKTKAGTNAPKLISNQPTPDTANLAEASQSADDPSAGNNQKDQKE